MGCEDDLGVVGVNVGGWWWGVGVCASGIVHFSPYVYLWI